MLILFCIINIIVYLLVSLKPLTTGECFYSFNYASICIYTYMYKVELLICKLSQYIKANEGAYLTSIKLHVGLQQDKYKTK